MNTIEVVLLSDPALPKWISLEFNNALYSLLMHRSKVRYNVRPFRVIKKRSTWIQVQLCTAMNLKHGGKKINFRNKLTIFDKRPLPQSRRLDSIDFNTLSYHGNIHQCVNLCFSGSSGFGLSSTFLDPGCRNLIPWVTKALERLGVGW